MLFCVRRVHRFAHDLHAMRLRIRLTGILHQLVPVWHTWSERNMPGMPSGLRDVFGPDFSYSLHGMPSQSPRAVQRALRGVLPQNLVL